MRLFRLVILLAAVAIVVFSAGMALGQEGANATRVLPDTVESGGTFNVTVTFTADGDNFSSISLNDHPPLGWNLETDKYWCTPTASAAPPDPNKTDISWWTIWPNGTPFTVVYKVTVPGCNLSGNYSFSGGMGFYSDEYVGHEFQSVTGDSNVTVIPPAIRNTTSIKFYASNGTNPENKTLHLWSSTPCPLDWSLSDDADYMGHDWLSENPTNGSCTNVSVPVALSVNSSGMPLGDYSANITINANATTNETANNSPQIVPVTLHISLTGTLEGHVSFYRAEDPGDPTWETPIVVRFFDNSTKNETGQSPINVTTDAYGNFTIADIEIGTYDIGIKNCTALSRMVYGKNFTEGDVTLANFTLIEGDTDNDDMVDGWDYAMVLNNYGALKIADPTGWAANELWKGDFNRDYILDGWDYAAVLNNYGYFGDILIYMH